MYTKTIRVCRPIALDFVLQELFLYFVSEDMLGLEASSYVAFVIEKEKKPHAI